MLLAFKDAYTSNEIMFTWRKGPVASVDCPKESISLLQYDLVGQTLSSQIFRSNTGNSAHSQLDIAVAHSWSTNSGAFCEIEHLSVKYQQGRLKSLFITWGAHRQRIVQWPTVILLLCCPLMVGCSTVHVLTKRWPPASPKVIWALHLRPRPRTFEQAHYSSFISSLVVLMFIHHWKRRCCCSLQRVFALWTSACIGLDWARGSVTHSDTACSPLAPSPLLPFHLIPFLNVCQPSPLFSHPSAPLSHAAM